MPGLHPFALDVTQTRDVGAVLDAIERDLGPVDTAVLCAAVWHFTDFTDLDIETATQAFDVNVLGAYRVLIALVARMKAHGKGRIVIVASVAGYRGLPKSSAYGPTKAALINLAETLRAELEPHGIIVKLVNPGFVDTPMTRDNPFPMPGLVSSAFAARRIVAGMNGRAFEIVFPFWFALAMRIVRILPNALHFWLLRTFVIADRG